MSEATVRDIAGGRVPDPGGEPAAAAGWTDRFTGRTAPAVESGAAPWRRRWAQSASATPEHPRIWG
ncbi:hypothetical protein [Raineyella sp.]|uniref:hypothetical protein n=1 Tax=Raineyella sp. TaxID=1911550 RepID=UPI002B1F87F8|nr:hypothetical protein [Raineyella sp.]MEA5153564.1 hypothetical protein [Raineyella sp.]